MGVIDRIIYIGYTIDKIGVGICPKGEHKMTNTMESARQLAEMARQIIVDNPNMGNTIIEGYLIKWDMVRKIVFVTMGKYVYCGYITDSFNFVRWSRERA